MVLLALALAFARFPLSLGKSAVGGSD